MAFSQLQQGTSAQVIQHPKALTEPVVQQRKAGRRPKSVVSLLCWQRDRNVARCIAAEARQAATTEVQSLQTRLRDHEFIAATIRQQIADIKRKRNIAT